MVISLLLACNPSGPKDSGPTGPVTALGIGEGTLSADSASWTPILSGEDDLTDPRDLGFDPDGRLWVANREDDHTFIVTDPGGSKQEVERRIDGYAEHFMEETAALSFESPAGASPEYGNEFGSCGESRNTYDDTLRGNLFMGPVLWTTDLEIFANENPHGLGSHLDMLHQSPLCVGIAWERDNVYWVFDGYHDAIVRYDFQEDHDVGQDDHSDGIVYQLAKPEVTRVADAPGHMMIDPDTGLLYVADTGGGRILELDPSTGERGANLRAENEPLEEYAEWDGVEWREVVTGLDRPGGLAVGDGVLYVAEYGTGVLHAFDLDGTTIQTRDTGWGEAAVYGIELGPDGDLWVVNQPDAQVLRLDVE